MLKVFIEPDREFSNPLRYTWMLLMKNKSISYLFVPYPSEADIQITDSSESDFAICIDFYSFLKKGNLSHSKWFNSECVIKREDGKRDYLTTIFYMVNCLQEYRSDSTDEFGRFSFFDSFQFKYKNINKNLVQKYIDGLFSENEKLRKVKTKADRSRVFLSHDMDSVNGAFIQDGFSAVKKGKFWVLFNLFLNVILKKPDWLNVDKILKLEDEFDFKSTFYWIVNKGGINADYSIDDPSIRKCLRQVEQSGSENGLHKSISSDLFTDEIKKLGNNPLGNRYHFLKFRLPEGFDKIDQSGLALDSSLGFAEDYGFRNNYGLPFTPYNIFKNCPYSFVEAPLHLMDRTFYSYLKLSGPECVDRIITFIENNNLNCVISLLWHNNFFSEYKFHDYKVAIRKLLEYFYESDYRSINQEEIINEYSIKWQ